MYVYHPDDNKDDDAMMIDINIFGYVIYTTGEKCIRKKKIKNKEKQRTDGYSRCFFLRM